MRINAHRAAVLTLLVAFAANATAEVTSGTASRYDATALTIDQLAAMLPPLSNLTEATADRVVPNQFPANAPAEGEVNSEDPLAATSQSGIQAPAPLLSFDGFSSDDNQAVNGFRVGPPDTNGDVGLDFFVSYNNLGYSIYNKVTGARVAGPFRGNAFWAGFGGVCESNNDGDPIALFDHYANQWVFNQFAPRSGVQCFAISQGSDPRGPYFRYEFVVTPTEFNDYPKSGIWTDGAGQSAYTLTTRNFTPQANPFSSTTQDGFLLERDVMLAGGPAPRFLTGTLNTFNPDGIMPIHLDGASPTAPTGACALFGAADDNGGSDEYDFWEFCANWAQGTGNLRQLPSVPVPAFDGTVGNIPQPSPGGSLDDLSFFTYFRFSARVIDGEVKGVIAHTVDLGNDRAGIRWGILDLDNPNAIALDDTGTLAVADNLERWMGAATLDAVGNLGLVYTRGSGTSFPSVYFTGRETTDPAGTLQAESRCVDGTGVQTGLSRWGDYASASVDPVDGCTFYLHAEYVKNTGNFDWDTRVCAFRFPSCQGGQTVYTLLDTVPGQAGVDNTFTAINGTPNGASLYYFGAAGGSTNFNIGACGSVSIDLGNGRFFGFDVADGTGTAERTVLIPGTLAGRTLSVQAVDFGTCTKSNVTTTTF